MQTKGNPNGHQRPRDDFDTIVVGVDGSERNHAAVAWASHEADETKRKLVLVAGNDGLSMPLPMARFSADYTIDYSEDQTRQMLNRVHSQLTAEAPGRTATIQVESGKPADIILRAAEKADLVVVGKRGLGAVKRMLVGSTSIAVAGRSRVPVVVVPDQWVQATRVTSSIVVGVDAASRDEAVLEFAFRRARDLAVPLIAVHAWQVPQIYTWSPEDIKRWTGVASSELDIKLKPLTDRYADVEVVQLNQQGNPVMALLDAGDVAQLIVLGRHTGPAHPGGFAFGSTTRGVLHYSTCPVVVIPQDLDADAKPDEKQR